jgi:hypothetical protein
MVLAVLVELIALSVSTPTIATLVFQGTSTTTTELAPVAAKIAINATVPLTVPLVSKGLTSTTKMEHVLDAVQIAQLVTVCLTVRLA